MITVANVGNGTITDVFVNDTIYSGVTYVEIGTPSQGTADYNSSEFKIIWQVGTLTPLQNETLKFNVTLTPNTPGIFILNQGADLFAKGTNSTGGEVTDYGDLDVVVKAYTRDIKAVSQTPCKNVVVQGEIVGINVEVENLGDYYNETYSVRLFYNSSIIDTLRVFNQKPGNITTLRFAWDTSGVPPGTYIIKAIADVNEEILESNEENNNCTSATYIKVVIHDIAVTSQIPSPTIVVQGELVTIKVTVKNEGTETETFTVRCYYYGEVECCAGQEVIQLAPGETRILTFTWNTTGIPPGTYYIDARALPVTGELDTNDNACKSTATVTIEQAPVGGEIVDTDEEIIGYLKPIIIVGAMLTALAILGLAITIKTSKDQKRR
jgi:subtilase family serine protease